MPDALQDVGFIAYSDDEYQTVRDAVDGTGERGGARDHDQRQTDGGA